MVRALHKGTQNWSPPQHIVSVWNSHGINLSFSLLRVFARLCPDDDNDDDFKWLMYSTVRGFYVYQLQVKPIVIFSFENTVVSLIRPGLFTSSRNSVASVTHWCGLCGSVFFWYHRCLALCKSRCPYVLSHGLIIKCRVTNVICICHSLSVFLSACRAALETLNLSSSIRKNNLF